MTAHNVLLITSDQHNPFITGHAGDALVRTPALDQLAGEGTTFTAAYTNSPICMPARASLATGRYGSTIGCVDNGTPYSGHEADSWGHRLRAQDRPAVTFGKLHFEPDGDSGFDARLPLQAKKGYSGAMQGWARGDAPSSDMMIQHALDADTGEFEYTAYDRHTTEAACRWLMRDAPVAQPWAAHVSFAYPHYPFRAPDAYAPPTDADVPLPPAWHPADWPDHPEIAAHRRLMGLDERPLTEDELRRLRWVYSGMVGFLDAQVATVLDALAASGQADRTVVLYTSDHGDMLGSHGILMKSVMYDASARVPMVMRGPDIDADATCSVPVSLVDVFPTILAATGSKPSEADADLPGDSLVDLAGRSDDGGRVVLSEYHGPLSSAASYLIRRGRWKYVAHMLDDAPPQLFDVTVDPDELDDRASDPGLADVRASLDAELREILDPEATDEQIRASQRGASEGATLGRPKARVGPIPRTDTGAIAVGWTVPPPETMAAIAAT